MANLIKIIVLPKCSVRSLSKRLYEKIYPHLIERINTAPPHLKLLHLPKNPVFSPLRSFFFLLSCLLLLALISYLTKESSIHLTDTCTFRFFDIKNYFLPTNDIKTDSVKNILVQSQRIEKEIEADTNFVRIDTLKVLRAIKPIQMDKDFISKIEYPNNHKEALKYFFNALKNAPIKSTHILYYGDSQIEEDRFSGFLREKLQQHFGGSGYGWLSFMPVTPWIYPKITYSDNWQKWGCYTTAPIPDQIYGPMAQSFVFDSHKGKAVIHIGCNSSVFPSGCRFNKIKLFYGYAHEPVLIHYYHAQKKIWTDTLSSSSSLAKKEFAAPATDDIRLEIEGFESPYFYGLSLESYGPGVYVDNIALRGSSGTFFHLIPADILREFFREQNVSLIILQFGGNAMPMIDNEEKANKYARYIEAQIKTLKKIHPEVSILFVGPSDMSVLIDGIWQTHPYLEIVNEKLKSVAIRHQCAYFDLYQTMGGKNSMRIWVQQNLAAKDYIHFSPAGARKMAALLYYSLIKDFSDYEEQSF